MPTIAFVSSKGGAGKTTANVVLAGELAEAGSTVTIIDADPNQHSAYWASKDTCPENIQLVAGVTEETLIQAIEEAAQRTAFVLVDLEGTASMAVAYAISFADLVIIPMQGSELDALEAVKAVRLVRDQGRVARRSIPFALLLTRTSAAIRPEELRTLEATIAEQKLPRIPVEMIERQAFKGVISEGGSVAAYERRKGRPPEKSKAVANARAYMEAVIDFLQAHETNELKAAS